MSVEGTVVYDIKGPGTYLSRRREVLDGYTWAPLVSYGPVTVTRGCLSPKYASSLRVKQLHNSYIMSYQDTTPTVWQDLGSEVYVDTDTLIPKTKVARTAVVYMSDSPKIRSNATYVLANCAEARGTLYVDISGMFLHSYVLVFPNLRSAEEYRFEHDVMTVRWDAYMEPMYDENDLLTRPSTHGDMIQAVIGDTEILNENDKGVRVAEIVQQYPAVNALALISHVKRTTAVTIWKESIKPHDVELVMTSSIKLSCPEVTVDGNCRSYSWEELLSLVQIGYVRFNVSVTIDYSFWWDLLERNGIRVIVLGLCMGKREVIARGVT